MTAAASRCRCCQPRCRRLPGEQEAQDPKPGLPLCAPAEDTAKKKPRAVAGLRGATDGGVQRSRAIFIADACHGSSGSWLPALAKGRVAWNCLVLSRPSTGPRLEARQRQGAPVKLCLGHCGAVSLLARVGLCEQFPGGGSVEGSHVVCARQADDRLVAVYFDLKLRHVAPHQLRQPQLPPVCRQRINGAEIPMTRRVALIASARFLSDQPPRVRKQGVGKKSAKRVKRESLAAWPKLPPFLMQFSLSSSRAIR